MDGEPVVRVGLRQPRQLRRLAEGLHGQKLRTYEADIAFTRQWLVTLGVRGPLRIGGSWRPGHGVDRVYVDPQVEPGDWEPDLRLLALDIETTPDAGRLLACSLVAWGGGGEGVGGDPPGRGARGRRPPGDALPRHRGRPAHRPSPADPRAGPGHAHRLEPGRLRPHGAADAVPDPRRALQPGPLHRRVVVPGGRRLGRQPRRRVPAARSSTPCTSCGPPCSASRTTACTRWPSPSSDAARPSRPARAIPCPTGSSPPSATTAPPSPGTAWRTRGWCATSCCAQDLVRLSLRRACLTGLPAGTRLGARWRPSTSST